jgi:hypothetical protein
MDPGPQLLHPVLFGKRKVTMDELFRRALYGIAGELQVLAFQRDISQIYEADLRSATQRALQLRRASPVNVEAPVCPKTWKAGGIDIAVRALKKTGYEALAELKVWQDPNKINEALWDAWKMASAYKEGLAPYVYLIAAGPREYWESGKKLVQLWANRAWNTRELWDEFFSVMAKWVSGNKGPSELPAGMKTTLIGSIPVQLFEADPWFLRCTRIQTTPGPGFVVPTSEL